MHKARTFPKRKSKRSVSSDSGDNIQSKHFPRRMTIKFRAFNEQFNLILKRNSKLLAPEFTINEEDGQSKGESVPLPNKECFYHGYSKHHGNSSVALSTCDGMVINRLLQTIN